jgi:hypothetical protein
VTPFRDDERRLAFAGFLHRLAAGDVSGLEWSRFAVAHYRDEFLESIRRQTVELAIARCGGKEWSNSELQVLQFLEAELRRPEDS